MSSDKNRDLAKELVDFLVLEEKEKAPSTEQKTTVVNQDLGKTEVLPSSTNTAALPSTPNTAPIELDSLWKEVTAATKSKSKTKNREKTKTKSATESFALGGKTEASGSSEIPSSPTEISGGNTIASQAEALKVVQGRIRQLEQERDELRDEAEKLLTASETLQRRLAESKATLETAQRQWEEKIEVIQEEKIILKTRIQAKESELDHFKKENEELKSRFQNDLRKVRVRERELENRMELMRAEHLAVVRAKDELILNLKRQLDQLEFELDNFRAKTSEMNNQMSQNHERNHRTVKALRLALSMLEGASEDGPQVVPLKKAGGQS